MYLGGLVNGDNAVSGQFPVGSTGNNRSRNHRRMKIQIARRCDRTPESRSIVLASYAGLFGYYSIFKWKSDIE